MKSHFALVTGVAIATSVAVITASVMFAPAAVSASLADAPLLSLGETDTSSTVSWNEPASTAGITGYRIQVNGADEHQVSALAEREVTATWGESSFVLSSPTDGQLQAASGSSALLGVSAIAGDDPQPMAYAVVNSGGEASPRAAEVTVQSRVADSVTLSLAPAAGDGIAVNDWTVAVQAVAGGKAPEGARLLQHSADPGEPATLVISGLSVSSDLVFYARGSGLSDDATPTAATTEWGAATSTLDSFTEAPVPTITGTASVGSRLSVTTGTWEPAPTSFAYQWMRNGMPISGATDDQYGLVADDLAARISVTVTATRSGYAPATQVSSETTAVTEGSLTSTPIPTVSGTARVGSTLMATSGTWGPDSVDLDYQWLRNGSVISNATSSTYVLAAADLGAKVSVRVTGVKSGFASVSRTSAVSATVAAGTVTSPTPTISGSVRVGSKLTAVTTAWSPAPLTFTYQWLRGGTAISGATGSTYTPTSADLSLTLSVRVTATRAGFTTVSKTSAVTAKVALGVLAAPTPTLSGTVQVGSKLTASPGTWGPAPVVLTYQWSRNGTAISGATASSYVLTSADLGTTITVRVTGKKTAYSNASKTSAATAAVARGVFTSTPTPTVTGTAKVGVRLTAWAGTWGPGAVTLKYQWFGNGTAIIGATSSTYSLAASDLGKTMTVRVAASRTGYNAVSKTSAATGTVVAGTLIAPVPKVTGTVKVGSKLAVALGTWGPGSVGVKYQWLRNGAAISGATGSTYTLSSSDLGAAISVKVTGARTGYTPASKTSGATAAVAPGTLTSTPVPSISGTAKVGSRLTASAGTWGPGAVTLKYQWLRNGSAISGATGSSYVLTSSDANRTISVRVTGSRAGYSSASKTSASTGTVIVRVRISGDGLRFVPSELARSVYVTTSKTLSACYWETKSGFSGSFSDIVNNYIGDGQSVMEITSSAIAVETNRCGSWILLGDMPAARKTTVPGDGVWSVQKQIVPGVYRASDGTQGCYWGISSDFTGDTGSILENYFGYASRPAVRIYSDDISFESHRCGTWTRISD